MSTTKQIEAQLKTEQSKIKRDIISHVMESVMHILYDSQLYESSLWPKNGFKSGYTGEEKMDTITIGILVINESGFKKIQFNIWGKERRVLKQRRQLALIFDQCVYDNLFFYPESSSNIDQISMCAQDYDDGIMDMLSFKFDILDKNKKLNNNQTQIKMASLKENITEEAQRLKVFRKAEKLGQEEFGKKTGVDHSIVSRYENGRLNISIEYVKTLHEVFNMSFTWFYTGKGSRKHIEEKATLVTDMKTFMTNQQLMIEQINSLKTELLKLHREFHAFKAGA